MLLFTVVITAPGFAIKYAFYHFLYTTISHKVLTFIPKTNIIYNRKQHVHEIPIPLEYARICDQMQDCIHRIIKKVIKSSGNTDISNIRSAQFDFRYLPIYIANKHTR